MSPLFIGFNRKSVEEEVVKTYHGKAPRGKSVAADAADAADIAEEDIGYMPAAPEEEENRQSKVGKETELAGKGW